MREELSTTHAKELFVTALEGQNFSPKTIRAYRDDLSQFTAWLETIRVDWDTPKRLGKVDIEAFLHHLSGIPLTGVTRARKLAAIPSSSAFCRRTGSSRPTLRPPSAAPDARKRSRASSIRSSTKRCSTRPQSARATTRSS